MTNINNKVHHMALGVS